VSETGGLEEGAVSTEADDEGGRIQDRSVARVQEIQGRGHSLTAELFAHGVSERDRVVAIRESGEK
jgi:hypothetical protein